MGKISTFYRTKEKENFLTPVSLVGVVVPWKNSSDGDQESDFKLVTARGAEYTILTDSEWERVFSGYRWEEVKVGGLLNASNMTVVPQWVVPHGPTGEPQRVTDHPVRRSLELVNKIRKTVTDLVLVPAYA